MEKESGSSDPPADDTATPDPSSVIQVSLAEFGKLRDEISGRSGAAWTLLGLNATVSTTVTGFVLAQKANPLLLLLLPLLTPALGLLFIDHAVNISNIGRYINTVLKAQLREAAGDSRLLGYEEWVDTYEQQPVWRLLPFGIPLVLLFNVVPVASLIYTAVKVDTAGGGGWALWVMGLVLTTVQLCFWVVFLAPPLRRAMEKRAL
jgi:hypothetical protein